MLRDGKHTPLEIILQVMQNTAKTDITITQES